MTVKIKKIADKYSKGSIVLYKNRLEVKLEKDTVWLTQAQIAGLFQAERSVITKHVRNILRSKELDELSVCAKFAHTAADGKNTRQNSITLMPSFQLDIALILRVQHNPASGRLIS